VFIAWKRKPATLHGYSRLIDEGILMIVLSLSIKAMRSSSGAASSYAAPLDFDYLLSNQNSPYRAVISDVHLVAEAKADKVDQKPLLNAILKNSYELLTAKSASKKAKLIKTLAIQTQKIELYTFTENQDDYFEMHPLMVKTRKTIFDLKEILLKIKYADFIAEFECFVKATTKGGQSQLSIINKQNELMDKYLKLRAIHSTDARLLLRVLENLNPLRKSIHAFAFIQKIEQMDSKKIDRSLTWRFKNAFIPLFDRIYNSWAMIRLRQKLFGGKS